MSCSRKKPNIAGGVGGWCMKLEWNWNEDMEFPLQKYWRKSMWKFQRAIKKYVEFPGVFKKNSSGICHVHDGSWFLTLEFPRQGVSVTQFYRISRGEIFFSQEFLRVKSTNLKFQGEFSKKKYSGIAHWHFVKNIRFLYTYIQKTLERISKRGSASIMHTIEVSLFFKFGQVVPEIFKF